MKRLLLKSLIFLFIFNFQLISQQYKYSKEMGRTSYMFNFRSNANHILKPPLDNQLSAWQDLPFKWEFYGQEVSGYYISDNGYITFDKQSTISDGDKKSLKEKNVPHSSIFAFWNDHILESGNGSWNNEVATATLGDAPNRIHIIYWMGIVPKGFTYSTTNISFAIAIYEGGGFDVVFTASRRSSVISGSVGAVGPEGLDPIEIDESPAYQFPDVGFGDTDDISFVFTPDYETDIHQFENNASELNGQIINNELRILSNINAIISIKFYDVLGKVVYQGNLNILYGLNIIDLNRFQLPAGLNFLVFDFKNKIMLAKKI